MAKADGGTAFPALAPFEAFDDAAGRYRQTWSPVGGMTLRDYFAAQALAGLIKSMADAGGLWNEVEASKLAYQFADSMLKAREP